MIFAAGLGTRLKPFTLEHPKALAPVAGKTLLEHSIRYLMHYGINDIVINVHHFASQIIEYLKAHQNFGANIIISDETDAVLETGGGFLKAQKYFHQEDVLVMNVDILCNLNLQHLIEYHNTHKNKATLAIRKRISSRQLLWDNHLQLCGWQNTQTTETKWVNEPCKYEAYAFSGIQILHSSCLEQIPFQGKFSIIDLYLHIAKTQAVKGFVHTQDWWMDLGKPENIIEAEQYFSTLP